MYKFPWVRVQSPPWAFGLRGLQKFTPYWPVQTLLVSVLSSLPLQLLSPSWSGQDCSSSINHQQVDREIIFLVIAFINYSWAWFSFVLLLYFPDKFLTIWLLHSWLSVVVLKSGYKFFDTPSIEKWCLCPSWIGMSFNFFDQQSIAKVIQCD